jgi:hypothetical protein
MAHVGTWWRIWDVMARAWSVMGRRARRKGTCSAKRDVLSEEGRAQLGWGRAPLLRMRAGPCEPGAFPHGLSASPLAERVHARHSGLVLLLLQLCVCVRVCVCVCVCVITHSSAEGRAGSADRAHGRATPAAARHLAVRAGPGRARSEPALSHCVSDAFASCTRRGGGVSVGCVCVCACVCACVRVRVRACVCV